MNRNQLKYLVIRAMSGIIGLCVLSCIGDRAFFTVLWCFFLYLYRDKPKQKWLA